MLVGVHRFSIIAHSVACVSSLRFGVGRATAAKMPSTTSFTWQDTRPSSESFTGVATRALNILGEEDLMTEVFGSACPASSGDDPMKVFSPEECALAALWGVPTPSVAPSSASCTLGVAGLPATGNKFAGLSTAALADEPLGISALARAISGTAPSPTYALDIPPLSAPAIGVTSWAIPNLRKDCFEEPTLGVAGFVASTGVLLGREDLFVSSLMSSLASAHDLSTMPSASTAAAGLEFTP
mmetsp:Transcript_10442/g.30253  ORF Transcript_10442/g.30253 Transcript_10442/m.30253 type:complete len:241 (-) Transcript_10442:422-1144(-)